jgi:hypothetical protein
MKYLLGETEAGYRSYNVQDTIIGISYRFIVKYHCNNDLLNQ